MFVAALLAVLASMVLALTRALVGPTLYDRILAINILSLIHISEPTRPY